TYGQVINSGNVSEDLGDWSWINGALYSVNTSNQLVKFTPATGFVNLGAVSVSGGIGATYTDGKYLYAGVNANGDVYRIDIATLASVKVSSGQPTSGNDGARCASAPIPTITVKKQVAGRNAPADQFTVGLKTSAGVSLTTATTMGTATTASTTNWPVSQGATYTITDAMAAGSANSLSSYTATISCVDKAGNPVTTGGSSPNWTLNVASATDYTCTVTNTPGSSGPAWSCTAYGYLFQSPDANTHRINQVDLVSGAAPQIAATSDAVNGVGYNTLDGYIYGWDTDTNQLVRVAADGTL